MLRIVATLAAALVLSGAALADAREATIAGGALHATLQMPAIAKDGPAVLLIAGSGPTDRDGNSAVPSVKPATAKWIAESLAEHGIASLRFDKRGVAASKAAMTSEADLRFSTYVDDAVAWAEYLKSQPHVTCVVILGHSEGALIAALAAQKTKTCGVISVAGAGFPAGQVLLKQLSDRGLPPATLDQARTMIDKLNKGEMLGEVGPGWAALFRPSVQPYLISWFPIDPATALGAVKAPVLILQGTTDIQVSVEDAKRLASSTPKAKLLLLKGVNHVLKTAPPENAANLATYADPALPLAPAVMPAILDFVTVQK